MLGDAKVIATVAVSNLAKSKVFYGDVLGLKQVAEMGGGVAYTSGGGDLFIYQSGTAGSGQATCANWTVEDIEDVVTDLQSKGVTFEHYDMPGAELKGDVHVMGEMKAAWFKDPDGNVLGLSNNLH